MSFTGQIMHPSLGALQKSNQFAMPMHHLPLKPGLPTTDSVQALIDEKRQQMGLYPIQTATNASQIQTEVGIAAG